MPIVLIKDIHFENLSLNKQMFKTNVVFLLRRLDVLLADWK